MYVRLVNTNQVDFNQYAHIIPYSDDGDTSTENIVWLCYACHKKYEPKGTTGKRRQQIVEELEKIRDSTLSHSLVGGVFDELLTDGNPVVTMVGNVEVTKFRKLFSEKYDYYRPTYLSLYSEDDHIIIEGHFKDARGFTIFEFNKGSFVFNKDDVWDMYRGRGEFNIINTTRDFELKISQQNDLSILVEGSIYLGDDRYSITKNHGIRGARGGGFDGISMHGNRTMMYESHKAAIRFDNPPPLPRPIGHIKPNYITKD